MTESSKSNLESRVRALFAADPELEGPRKREDEDDELERWERSLAEADAEAVDAAWRRFADARMPSKPPSSGAGPRPWLLAAALAAVFVGLVLLVARLPLLDAGRRAALDPVATVQAIDLVSSTVRGIAAEGVPQVTGDAEILVLFLEPQDRSIYPRYRLEATAGDGASLFTTSELAKNEYGMFSVALMRDALPNGRIDLTLEGVRGTERSVLGRYAFDLLPGLAP